MSNKEYKIRRMKREDLDIAIDWAAKEGWNPGKFDTDSFWETDPEGFYIGLIGDEPISCISAVAYDDSFGFVGFYIVKPEFRGKGYGYAIWKESLKHLSTQNIGLDGVVEQQENYKKSGFKFAYRNIRYVGLVKQTQKKSSNVVKLSELPFESLLSYDEKLFPSSRPQFLKHWIRQPRSLAVGTLIDKKLSGYGVIRKCRDGYKMGPLFANDKDIAEELFLSLCNFVKKGTKIYLDTPEINKEAVLLADKYNMNPMFETARMYTKNIPSIPVNKIFGVTTFELG